MDDGQAIPQHPLPFLLPSPTKNNLQDLFIPPRQPRQPSRSPSARNNTSKARLLLATLAAFLALDGAQAVDATLTATRSTSTGGAGERGLELEGKPTPDLPEFLCPSLALATPLPHPVPHTRTASEAYQSQAERQDQDRIRRRERKECDTASARAVENSHQPYPYLARSTFSTASLLSLSSRHSSPSSSSFLPRNTFTHSHDDRLPLVEGQLVLDDEANSRRGSRTETEHGNIASDNNNVGSNRSAPSNFSASKQEKPKRARIRRRNSSSTDDFNNSHNNNERRTDVDEGDTSTHQCLELYTSRTIPDRYELGNDGRWHKLSVSSSCSLCECESQNIDDAADTDLSSTGVVNADTSLEAEDSYISGSGLPSSPSTDIDSRIVLPVGWDRSFDSVVYQVPLIVIASLLVAASVTGSVWFVFFWRRRQKEARRQSQERDLEKRKRGEENESDGSGNEDDGGDGEMGRGRRGRRTPEVYSDGRRRREERVKARLARATEKWKSHVRWIHRRKRGRGSIIDGTKPRDAAMASGISLARSVASGPSLQSRQPEGNANGDSASDSRRSSRSGPRPPGGRSNNAAERGESEGESSSSAASSDAEGTTGNVRVRGSPSSRVLEPYSEHSRSVVILPDQGQNRSSQNSNDEREDDRVAYVCRLCLSRSRSRLVPLVPGTDSDDRPIPASSSSFISSTIARNRVHPSWVARGEYDRPPPEILPSETVTGRVVSIPMQVEVDENEARQGPPAYQSRRSHDDAVGAGRRGSRRRRGRRRVDVNDKRVSAAAAAASSSGTGYVPAPGDYAPYPSSDDGEDAGSESETRSTASSSSSTRSRRREQVRETTMHVAVDDKQALARLAAYASAPPPPPLPHSDSTFSTNSSSPLTLHPSSSLPSEHTDPSVEPNAPPEPEWEGLEDYGYGYECDSPGAGPGPSTASARSRSASRNYSPSGSRSPSRSRQSRSSAPSSSLFPAPPAPRSSKLAYAPADAGLSLSAVQPPDSDYGYGKNDFGLDLDSALDRLLRQGVSAPPPFSASSSSVPASLYPYDEVGLGITPSAPPIGDGDTLNGASAPPLFVDDEVPEGERIVNERVQPSAPPDEDDLYVDDVDVGVLRQGKDVDVIVASAPSLEEPQESERTSNPNPHSPPPPDTAHVEGADRNSVLSAVR